MLKSLTTWSLTALAGYAIWRLTGRGTPAPAIAGTRAEAMIRWEDDGGPATPEPPAPADWQTEPKPLAQQIVAAPTHLGQLLRDLRAAPPAALIPAAALAGFALAALLPVGRPRT